MVDIIEPPRASAAVAAPREFSTVGGRWIRLARELPLVPLAILVPFILVAIFANFIAPYDPTEPIPGAKIFEPPSGWRAAARIRSSAPTFNRATC